jgi:hypothetical protein
MLTMVHVFSVVETVLATPELPSAGGGWSQVSMLSTVSKSGVLITLTVFGSGQVAGPE